MTTIAYRDGIVAADTRGTRSERIVPRVEQKLFRLKNGDVAAICGSTAHMYALMEWLESDRTEKQPGGDGSLILFGKDGSIRVFEDGHHFPETGEFGAWGSDSAAALGALHAGASAKVAVRCACQVDIWSGGNVVSMRIAE